MNKAHIIGRNSRTTKNSVKTALDNIAEDPFAVGWDAGENIDDPLPCPFTEGMAAKLWRQGYSSRIDAHIASAKSAGGLHASLLQPSTPSP